VKGILKMHGLQKDQDVGLVLKAMAFAAVKHRDQRRKDADASPYINHRLLWRTSSGTKEVFGIPRLSPRRLLHDTIEDTKTTAAELRRRFGAKIAGIVREVTEMIKRLPKERRKGIADRARGHISRRARSS